MLKTRWMFVASALLAIALGLSACSSRGNRATAEDAQDKPAVELKENEVAITYYGQDAFLLANDIKIAIAPHDDRVGFPMEEIEADVVLINDDPAAREQAKAVKGDPEIVAKVGEQTVKGIAFQGVEASRRAAPGAEPEKVIIYAFEVGGVRYAHLGALGQKLTAEQVKAIGPVGVAMVPVGGGDALDPEEAWAVVDQLKPRMVIPMHYQTEKTKPELGLKRLEEFTKLASKPDASGKPRAIALGGGHTMAMSESRLPADTMRISYSLSPW